MSKIFSCPNCLKKLDAHTSVSEKEVKPKSGDITVCFYCGTIMVFNEDMSMHVADIGELNELATNSPSSYQTVMKARNFILSRVKMN